MHIQAPPRHHTVTIAPPTCQRPPTHVTTLSPSPHRPTHLSKASLTVTRGRSCSPRSFTPEQK